jgi:WD40 repeat protein
MYATAVPDPEGGILIYETASGNVRSSIRGFRGQVQALAFFPGGRLLASSLSDATVVLWDLTSLPPAEKGPSS